MEVAPFYGQGVYPRARTRSLGLRVFSIAVPTVWNSLSEDLRDETEDIFLQSLKTLLFGQLSVPSALEVLYYALYKLTFYLLTYFQ